jgi:hypothetical protein
MVVSVLKYYLSSRVVSGKERVYLSSIDVVKGDIGLIALMHDMDCDKTAMNLPPVASAVLVIAKQ